MPNPLCPYCGAPTHIYRRLKDDQTSYRCSASSCKRSHGDRSVGRPVNPDKPTKAQIQKDYRARMTPERREAENQKQRDRRAKRKLKDSRS